MIDHIVILNDLSQPKGGATALALDSAMAFCARGLKVTFLTGDAGGNEALIDAGAEIVALGGQRLLSGSPFKALVEGVWNGRARAMVARWIARNDTPRTVYHLHGWSQILSPSVFSALEPVRDRLVISGHDFFLACPNGAFADLKTGAVCPAKPLSLACIGTACDRRSNAQKTWRLVRYAVQRHVLRPAQCPRVLAIHGDMRPFLRRAGIPDTAIHTLPNPVVAYSDARIAAERNVEVLFVGRLEATKGPDLAAEAARRAGARIRFIGDGAMADQLRREYPDAKFEGRRTPDEIKALARNARMLVMPSRYPEPFGLVAVEALWSGLPVILSDTALLARDIVAAGAGVAVDPRDPQAFTWSIRAIMNSDAACRRMSEAAFSDTRKIALSPEDWIDQLLDHYRDHLRSRTQQAAKCGQAGSAVLASNGCVVSTSSARTVTR
jgi:glycosyltransferase involved in cell wall biosynthesis